MNNNISWQAYEFDYVEKTSDWYWALWIICIAVAVTSILFDNVILAIFILLAGFTTSILASKHPRLITYEITPRGVKANNTLYTYSTIESFWVEETPGRQAKILLKSARMFMPYIVIPITEVDPDDVRTALDLKLAEVEQHESIFHHFMEYLGF